MEQSAKLSHGFFKLASFTLLMLSVLIFFGSIFLTMVYIVPSIQNYQQALTSTDMITKAFLTAIFVMQFAIMMTLNYIVLLLEKNFNVTAAK